MASKKPNGAATRVVKQSAGATGPREDRAPKAKASGPTSSAAMTALTSRVAQLEEELRDARTEIKALAHALDRMTRTASSPPDAEAPRAPLGKLVDAIGGMLGKSRS
jgi:hypothetical protein